MTGQFDTIITFCRGVKTSLRFGVPLKSLASIPPALHCKHILRSWLRLEASEQAGFSTQATAYVEQTEERLVGPSNSCSRICSCGMLGLCIWQPYDIFYYSKFLFNWLEYRLTFFFFSWCHQGHFPYPDPSQWTDEELGILPDDEDWKCRRSSFQVSMPHIPFF